MGLYLSGGVLLPLLLYLGMTLTDIGSDTNLGVFAVELFPTSHRSTADGARVLIGQLGGSLGLAAESLLFAWLGSHALAVSTLAAAGLVVPVIVAAAYPETSRLALEDSAPERARRAEGP